MEQNWGFYKHFQYDRLHVSYRAYNIVGIAAKSFNRFGSEGGNAPRLISPGLYFISPPY